MPKFEIGAMLEGIERHQVTVAAVVLALAKNPVVEKHDLSSIRIVLSGVAPLGRELEEVPRSRVPQAVFGQVLFRLVRVLVSPMNRTELVKAVPNQLISSFTSPRVSKGIDVKQHQ
uniref:Uncharacterized protein n=1 Tax=Ananas comosus var. bracteatus TaxID=296719 RepID=A0A6V7QPC8_ANACO|nr:unnamed protein product [Ananas comosus var. bracteatus]